MKTKICTKCNKELLATRKFFAVVKNSKTGLETRCKKCLRDYGRKYRKNRSKDTRSRDLKRYYNMTLEQYDKMFETQNGVCAVCGKSETTKNLHVLKRLSVDHNHETGKIRGLLCSRCNLLLGGAQDNIKILINLIRYLLN